MMIDRKKVIKGLECCTTAGFGCIENKECPYSAQRYGSHCVDSMLRDAIALLKAQEPEALDMPKPDSEIGCWYDITHNYTLEQVVSALQAQEPRVMTLEEWKNLPEPKDGECLCYEINDGSRLQAMLIKAFVGSVHLYGKAFRCWTSRPTNEQREATAWQQ